jgi:hypothetical protein
MRIYREGGEIRKIDKSAKNETTPFDANTYELGMFDPDVR